jgi:fibronectin type 3 domain-containing protein
MRMFLPKVKRIKSWAAARRVQGWITSWLQDRRRDRVPGVPTAPTGLVAVSDLGNITLTWTDQSSNETGFRIYRKPYNETFTMRAQVFANQTSFVDWAAELGIPYTYYVVAFNAAGMSAQSNQATGTVLGG